MADNSIESAQTREIRPVIVVDQTAVEKQMLFLGHFSTALADESGRAAIVCPPDFDTSIILSPSIEVVTYPLCKIPLFWRHNRAKLFERIEKFNPTIVHCLSGGKAGLARNIAAQFRIPYLLSWYSFEKISRAEASQPLCAGIIVPCQSIRQKIAKDYPNCSAKLIEVGMGTFIAETCASFAQPNRITSMIAVCSLENAEDLEPLLNAARHLIIENYSFVMIIIGAGKEESKVRRMIWSMGLAQIVNVTPPFNPLRAALEETDIFIRPKLTNEFSTALLEAMAVGTATAACKGGVDDWIIENQTAVIFNADDSESIYAALQKLLNSRELAVKIAMGAQSNLRRNNTVSKMMSGLIAAYKNASRNR